MGSDDSLSVRIMDFELGCGEHDSGLFLFVHFDDGGLHSVPEKHFRKAVIVYEYLIFKWAFRR